MARKFIKEESFELQPSTLENIDIAFFEWVDKEIDAYCETEDGWKKVPVIWAGTERFHQIKENRDIRADNGTLKFPLISVSRESYKKSLQRKGPFWGNVPPIDNVTGGNIAISRRISPEKTASFRNEQSMREKEKLNFMYKKNEPKSILYETLYIPALSYLDMIYRVSIRTNYEQQMNSIVSPFAATGEGINYFLFGRNGHKYEGFLPEEFSTENNVNKLAKEERIFKTVLSIRVLGYLQGNEKNQKTPRVVRKESIVEIKFPREHDIFEEDKEK